MVPSSHLFVLSQQSKHQKKAWNMFKAAIKTPERRQSGVFIVNFEHILHLFLVFMLLTLSKQMLAG